VYELRLERAEPAGAVRVSLAIDVPHVANAEGTWAEMIATARAVASRVDGRLVDDSNRPLNEAGLQSLGRSIAANQDRMRAAGIEPGGVLAARLYS
jgi:FtsZ-interacting cell division protein ZipA